MRAIIWKEIRENLKWAVLLMLGVGVCLAWVLYELRSPWNAYVAAAFIEMSQVVTAIGAAVCASLLGLLQTVPELWRDQWAFLVHRPISRTRLFFGKVAAGLLLYGMAMLVPFFAAAAWAAAPGHLAAPFEWRYLLPGLADVFGGVTFYFAGLLAGIRQARWYGSRALPFVLAVICEICVIGFPQFWMALLATAIGLAVLTTAAWGSFIASGQYGSQPRMAKGALGIVLAVGVSGVGLVTAILVAEEVEVRTLDEWTGYFVDGRCRVLKVTCGQYDSIMRQVTDLAGNAVPEYEGRPFDDLHRKGLRFYALTWEQPPWRVMSYREHHRFVTPLGGTGEVSWYFVPSERLIAGYNRQTRMRIGTIGPDGFSSTSVPSSRARFPDEQPTRLSPPEATCLVFPSGAYLVDLRARRAQLMGEGQVKETILDGAVFEADHGGRRDQVKGVGLVTPSRLYLFGVSDQKPVETPHHYPREEYPNVKVAVAPDGGYAIWYSPARFGRTDGSRNEHLVLVSAAGEEVARYDLPTIRAELPPPTWPHALWASIIPIGGLAVWICGGLLWTCYWYGGAAAAGDLSYMQHLFTGPEAQFTILSVAILLVGAVIWAAVVFGIARRYAFSRKQTFGWTVGGLLLGPVGLLTLLALREWPARLACASSI